MFAENMRRKSCHTGHWLLPHDNIRKLLVRDQSHEMD